MTLYGGFINGIDRCKDGRNNMKLTKEKALEIYVVEMKSKEQKYDVDTIDYFVRELLQISLKWKSHKHVRYFDCRNEKLSSELDEYMTVGIGGVK